MAVRKRKRWKSPTPAPARNSGWSGATAGRADFDCRGGCISRRSSGRATTPVGATLSACRGLPAVRWRSVRRKYEPVSFAVPEHSVSAPRLFLWRPFELHATLFQLLVRFFDIIASVRHVHERADPFFVSLRRKQHHARFRFRNSQFNPALLLIERLICNDREPES